VPRFFNTSGVNQPERHYTLPELARLPEVRGFIDEGLYFGLHAPRQVGKTTSLLALAKELTADGGHVAILVSMEVGAPFSHDPGAAELAILDAWRDHAAAALPPDLQPPPWPDAAPGRRIGAALAAWARAAPRPLVIFLDEIERLREPRVRAIIEPMLAGEPLGDVPEDDIRFAIDLGLVRLSEAGGLVVANPIYREVIVRTLAGTPRASLPQIPVTWLTPEGRLDKDRLLASFLDFWRQHGEPLLGAAPYHEVAPHLVLMAFLHRVINGGGSIEREYAIGSGRMDLCLRYAGEELAIEIKVWRPGRPDPIAQGLAQLDGYLTGLGLDSGWLVIFDRRPRLPPIEERLSTRAETSPGGRRITVIRA
jgi:hypothetical protein